MDAELRDFVRHRAASRCEYCQLPDYAEPLPFHVEHIVARQHGGSDEAGNLAWSCNRCNAYKGTNLSSVDPETDQIVELFHPRFNNWDDHFRVLDATIVGLSASGRATVRLLQINAKRRVDVRRDLLEGERPD
jgi:5-methylcytosine-specific restriction endonuclease McrA